VGLGLNPWRAAWSPCLASGGNRALIRPAAFTNDAIPRDRGEDQRRGTPKFSESWQKLLKMDVLAPLSATLGASNEYNYARCFDRICSNLIYL
jgi:hypothetical protein